MARLAFVLLAATCLGAMIVLAGVMPRNHAGAGESRLVSVLRMAKIPAGAFVMNFVVLTAAPSGANAKLYVASRLLFSMGRNEWVPAAFGAVERRGIAETGVAAFVLWSWDDTGF